MLGTTAKIPPPLPPRRSSGGKESTAQSGEASADGLGTRGPPPPLPPRRQSDQQPPKPLPPLPAQQQVPIARHAPLSQQHLEQQVQPPAPQSLPTQQLGPVQPQTQHQTPLIQPWQPQQQESQMQAPPQQLQQQAPGQHYQQQQQLFQPFQEQALAQQSQHQAHTQPDHQQFQHQAPPPQQFSQLKQFQPQPQEDSMPKTMQDPMQTPMGWTENFFYTNGRRTPAFEALIKAFFTKLDTQGTGFITPEQYSEFLDALQYLTEWNAWKRNLTAAWVYTAQDVADAELKAVFEGFYFDHKVAVRDPASQLPPGGGMPLLSLEGLTDHMALEWASAPHDHLHGVNLALRHYGIWPERVPIPRHLFPATCPPQLQARIDEALMRCTANAKAKINASAVRLSLEQLGQQNAVELADDRRWKREYQYY
ncbi:hypothetical protein HDU89_002679 [Geranomyces variabilis]|nr:hypothetical protein HDU89_002679 [Geranomyces variabilis]